MAMNTVVIKRNVKNEIAATVTASLTLITVGIAWYFVEYVARNNFDVSQWKTILCVALGCFSGAVSTELCGRKLSMIIINIVVIVSWVFMWFIQNQVQLAIGFMLLHFNVSFMFTPVITYISEISQPRHRSSLIASGFLFVSLGVMFEVMLERCVSTRTTVLLNCLFPSIAIALTFFLPESPFWLIRSERINCARKSLIWLTKKDNGNHTETELKCLCKEMGKNQDLWIEHPEYSLERGTVRKRSCFTLMYDMTRRPFANSLTTINLCHFVANFTGLLFVKYYYANLFLSYYVILRLNSFIALFELLQMTGIVASIVQQKYFGRRLFNIILLSVLCVLNVLLAIYTYAFHISYRDDVNESEHPTDESFDHHKYIAILSIVGVVIVVNAGVRLLPWILAAELFEHNLKPHGLAIAGFTNYMFEVVFKLFFVRHVKEITMTGMYSFFAFMAFTCVVFLYFNLLETEGKTLQKIQQLIIENRTEKRLGDGQIAYNLNEAWFIHVSDVQFK